MPASGLRSQVSLGRPLNCLGTRPKMRAFLLTQNAPLQTQARRADAYPQYKSPYGPK